jgi:nicotinate-nucleotide adenylyltransferase
VEIKRTGVSYTVDTLRQLHTDSPTDQFLLLLGADSLIGLPNWREPEEVVRLAKIAVARRPGESIAEVLLGNTHSKIPIEHVEMPLIDISSTRIRQRCAAGRSIRYLVPAAVEAYIHAHGLYAAAHEDENIGHSPTHD